MDKREYVEALLGYIRNHRMIQDEPLKMAQGGEVDVAPTDSSPTESTDVNSPLGAIANVGPILSNAIKTMTGIGNKSESKTPLTPPSQTQDRSTLGQPATNVAQPVKSMNDVFSSTPQEYQDRINSSLETLYATTFGWMRKPPISFKQFQQQAKTQTNGFNPLYTGGLLNPGDPDRANEYDSSVDLVRAMSGIDFNKALQYNLGGLSGLPAAYGAVRNQLGDIGADPQLQDQRNNYGQLVNALSHAVARPGSDWRLNIPSMEAMIKNLRTSGASFSQMKRSLLNQIETQYGIHVSNLDNMGLNDKWFKNNQAY